MSLPGLNDGERAQAAARTQAVKQWVREARGLGEDSVVLVSELQCREVGCPPREVVIAVLLGARKRLQWKIHRSLADLTREQVCALCATPHTSDADCSGEHP